MFRASDGAKLLVSFSEVYFPAAAQYDEYGLPHYQAVYVTTPGTDPSVFWGCCFYIYMRMFQLIRMFCSIFVSVFITRILPETDPLFGEKTRHLQAGNTWGFETGHQARARFNERHPDFISREICEGFKQPLISFRSNRKKKISCPKWKYAIRHSERSQPILFPVPSRYLSLQMM